MNTKYKKIIMVTAFVIVLGVFSFMIWLMFQKSFLKPSDPTLPPTNPDTDIRLPESEPITPRDVFDPSDPNLELEPDGTEPTTSEATPAPDRDNKITSPNSFPSIAVTPTADNSSVQYYDPLDNKFYRLNDNGEPVPLSNEAFYNVSKVNWSPDKNKAILEYPDNTKIIYNFNNNSQITLPKHWEGFEFSPTGDKIAFKSIGFEPENRWLSIVNSDGTQAQNIERLGTNADKATVNWSPNGQVLAHFQDGYDYNRKEIFFVGQNKENFKSMLVQGRNFESKYSPSGAKILYSVYSDFNDYKPSLWIADGSPETMGANTTPLALETWVDKCTFFSETKLYCAVPRALDAGAGLLSSANTQYLDDLYLIDLVTDSRQLISMNESYNMTNLIITNDGSTLYFNDQKTNALLKLPLP